MALVENPQIKSAELLKPLPTHFHAYIWPFTIAWPIFFRYYLTPSLYEKHIGSSEWTYVWCGSIITVQALVWLSTNWSVNLRARFTSSRVSSIQDAQLIKVLPIANAGSADICPLLREKVGDKINVSFLFQKRRFLYDEDRKSFATLDYAIDAEPKPSIGHFKSRELFKEHAVAPFFVFQIFCVGLWMLDEYWYYSLFTLFMLVAFESTVVWQRQRTLSEFRSMSIKPYDMWVFRLGKWVETQSDKLLPGDLVSIGRTKEDSGYPLLKDSIQLRPADAPIDPEGIDKNAFLWGGTKVLQVTHGNPDEERPKLASGVPMPPDGGAMAIVMKTGFETSQEAFLAALAKLAIFCTEPFRIPFGGRIDVACFDKTGTLTGEDLVVEAHTRMMPVKDVGLETTLVLATAHALVRLDQGEIVGDPMEKATLTSLGWTLGKNDVLVSKAVKGAATPTFVTGTVQIKRRFQFSSALKRQSAVATIVGVDARTGDKLRGTFAGVKGAPETIMKMLTHVPADYEETFKYFTRKGSRVLALAYKMLSVDSELGAGRINDLKREKVEADLTFAGFLVLHCPLKDDAKEAVQMLNESSHRVVMITGDNPLTAVHVAREVEIVDRDVLILDVPEDKGHELVWHSVDDKICIPVDPTKPIDPEILKNNDLCVTGYALAKFMGQPGWRSILRYTWDMGYYTLMAGDGTNDVGALKQAHIGIALLNGTQDDLQRIAEHSRNTRMKDMYQKQVDLMKRFNQPTPPKAMEREAKRKGVTVEELAKANGTGMETITSPAAQRLLQNQSPADIKKAEAAKKAAGFADKLTSSMLENELNDDEPPTLKLGDASVAAPFTSKLRNVIAVPNIIRQGRCTLVATIQMYKILALNCLISAYSLSVLYLEGIKFGDGQYTISGILMSVCFLSISRARTVEGLSKERPQPNIFNFYIIGSILGQFAVHIFTLIYIAQLCDRLEPRSGEVDLEAEFAPSLLNSAVYLLQLIQQISTFAVNYQGRPFRESLSENRAMFYGIVGVSGLAFACSLELIPEINEQMKLVPFSNTFKQTMTIVMAGDFAACYVIERVLKKLFSDYRPRDIAVRRPEQLEREFARKDVEQKKKDEEEEKKRMEQVAAFERRLEEKKAQLRALRQGA
ncbi:unnamed protein product [Parascedosporium putredinis]|uniref:P5A-ATPase transmembrane helical hairpin domain-containing protein n=1 Tax=Parascedosporium putredinis TaxID=1442378 RepID=A0A9P1M9C9_9PEZI|nr:unnamed protein product [Parascedosporium putredinis]CAI7991788.1 unnamed protein product [Parascedosporium putredinis]